MAEPKGRVPVISAGILVVDHVSSGLTHVPRAGELVLTHDCQLHLGGCAANVSIDLARLGIASRVVGSVGDDLFGRFVIEELSRQGVSTDDVSVVNEAPTSQTLVLNVRGEDRRFIHLVGANRCMTAAQIPETHLADTRVLYVGGLFLLDAMDPAALSAVFRRAREQQVTTMLDVVTPGPGNYLDALARVLPEVDYFLPNEDEARQMTGLATPAEQARVFRDLGARQVVITRGPLGCYYEASNEVIEAESFSVDAVDGTGGGDAFTAGFISGLIEGAPIEETLARASALGASCVRAMGASTGVFTEPQLTAFLRERSLGIRRHPVGDGARPSNGI